MENNERTLSCEAMYKEALSLLESSLTTSDARKEAINTLVSLGDYREAKLLAQRYLNELEAQESEEKILNNRRKNGRVLQYILITLGFFLITAVIVFVALAVRQAF